MTTPKPLPADIEAAWSFFPDVSGHPYEENEMSTPKLPADITVDLQMYADTMVYWGGFNCGEPGIEVAAKECDAALEKLTTLLSGYIEKAEKWDDHEAAKGSCNRGIVND